ncbi:reverse transcriptase [Gossypium australe]|uniref:Reverse transcriptase n=1 Tax=Gossypium australe TaxID=47621 RepID=A0A5B6WZR7_9ROSI|nr:reverse transcriptase [Gossypium australe]
MGRLCDFNEIMYDFEKKGGVPRDERRMEVFREVLAECGLVDMGFSGRWFTWERGNLPETNIRERLDRGVANEVWQTMFPDGSIQHLTHSFFDHCPLLMTTRQEECGVQTASFWFEAWWLMEETFDTEVRKDRDDQNMAELIDTKVQLNLEIDKDEQYWEQRARINWLRYGDKNTAYFHSQASSRRKKNTIQRMQNDTGGVMENIQDIENIARVYFQKLFDSNERECCDYLLLGIQRCITKEDNQILMAPYMKDEIREAIFGMGPTKAPGEDGFPAIFYQQCWHIVKDKVIRFCLQVLNEDRDFRQKRVGRKGFMAVKLDMSKAYDRVEWNFVKEVMIRMGFANGWIETIMECTTSVSYAVVINGFKGENFWPSRGLRQGDPLSPLLFLMCGERLSSLMRLAMSEGILKGVKASRSGPKISHLLFADDCILFSEASSRGANALKEILRKYRSSSRQCVNFDKSIVFFSKNTSEMDRNSVISILGVRSSNNPERYLGLPNVVGRKKKESFQILKDKMKQRIDHWSTRHLSQGGKEIFIKSILQAIPTYTMACFLLPKTFCAEIESIMAKFWWQKGYGKKGIDWCEWRTLCTLKEIGGLGFRNMCQFNIALLAKKGWRLINYPDSLLARVLKAKYFPNSNFLNSQLGNLPSLTWRSMWVAKGLLCSGMGWRVRRGTEISVWDDHWIPGKEIDDWGHRIKNGVKLVADLIDAENSVWKTELVKRTFTADIAEKFLQIPLAKNPGANIQVWRGELSGDFSTRSAYKILQNASLDPNALLLQTDTKKFYKKLWNLQLPSKLLITVWRASWNYLPTFANLRSKKIATSSVCPRCGYGEENLDHVFRFCPATNGIWQLLDLGWTNNSSIQSFWEWITWVFGRSSHKQRRLFCSTLWFLWGARNRLVHDKKIESAEELSAGLKRFMAEIEGVQERKISLRRLTNQSQEYIPSESAIYFDAAFNARTNKSMAGIVITDRTGGIVKTLNISNSNVPTPFTAEAYAGYHAVQLDRAMGFQTVKIKGDSRAVIKKCQTKKINKSVISAIIRDIQELSKQFLKIEFQFIDRNENKIAHRIAVEALHREEEAYLGGGVSAITQVAPEGRWRRSPD